MEAKYEKAIKMLKTEHLCPSVIAEECSIDEYILHDMSNGCYYDEWQGSCRFCREDALEYMMEQLKM